MVLSADSIGLCVLDTVTTYEVIADDADTLAEDVVVDLIIGAGDRDGSGSGGGRSVGGGGGSGCD